MNLASQINALKFEGPSPSDEDRNPGDGPTDESQTRLSSGLVLRRIGDARIDGAVAGSRLRGADGGTEGAPS